MFSEQKCSAKKTKAFVPRIWGSPIPSEQLFYVLILAYKYIPTFWAERYRMLKLLILPLPFMSYGLVLPLFFSINLHF